MKDRELPQPYEKFELAVENIKNNAAERIRIGGGSESNVFAVEIDGKSYVIKFAVMYTPSGRTRNTVAATQRKIDAGLRGLNIAGLEQIQSASTQEGVVIYRLVDGKTVCSMTEAELESVTDAQIAAFFEVVDTSVELGIQFDPWNQDGSNVIYSPDTGFTLIDFFVDYTKTTKEENRLNGYKSLGSQAVKLAQIFGNESYSFHSEWASVSDFL